MLFAIFVAVIRSQKHPPHPATARDRRQEGRSPLHRLLKLAILKNQRLALKKSSKSAKITFSWSTWASHFHRRTETSPTPTPSHCVSGTFAFDNPLIFLMDSDPHLLKP